MAVLVKLTDVDMPEQHGGWTEWSDACKEKWAKVRGHVIAIGPAMKGFALEPCGRRELLCSLVSLCAAVMLAIAVTWLGFHVVFIAANHLREPEGIRIVSKSEAGFMSFLENIRIANPTKDVQKQSLFSKLLPLFIGEFPILKSHFGPELFALRQYPAGISERLLAHKKWLRGNLSQIVNASALNAKVIYVGGTFPPVLKGYWNLKCHFAAKWDGPRAALFGQYPCSLDSHQSIGIFHGSIGRSAGEYVLPDQQSNNEDASTSTNDSSPQIAMVQPLFRCIIILLCLCLFGLLVYLTVSAKTFPAAIGWLLLSLCAWVLLVVFCERWLTRLL